MKSVRSYIGTHRKALESVAYTGVLRVWKNSKAAVYINSCMASTEELHTDLSSKSTCFPLEFGSKCLILTEIWRRTVDLIEYPYCLNEWLANSDLRTQDSQI